MPPRMISAKEVASVMVKIIVVNSP